MKKIISGAVAVVFISAGYSCNAEVDDLIKAAERGSKTATYSLGVKYAHGEDLKQDQDKANALYRRAAKMNYAPAQNNLGWSYRQGLGVKKNPLTAIYWFRLAALQNNALALQNLAEMFQHGEGVKQSDAITIDLYSLCATIPVINEGWDREAGFNNAILECRRELGTLILAEAGTDQQKLKMASFWISVSLVKIKDTSDDSEIGVRARRTRTATEKVLADLTNQLTPDSSKWVEENLKNWDSYRSMIQDTTAFPFTELDCGNYKDS